MDNLSENLESQFFFSRYKSIRTLVLSDDRKIEQIFYQPRQAVCILKTYYHRDISPVYQRLKGIRHENLAVVYDVLAFGGNTYVIEESVDGETLAESMKIRGVFSEKDVIHITEKVCNALEVLHSQKPPLIHRDIKPSNVMIREDGSIKLIDFDTVRSRKENEEQDTALLGTKEYASPEHYGYGQTDITSDIYSLGVMMNELLTGELLDNHKATYKGRLLPVINKCIPVDSRQRFQSAQQLRKVLVSYRKPWGILFRNKKKIAAGCMIALVLLAVTLPVLKRQNQWPDLSQAYKEETNQFLLLENPKVDRKLKRLLGPKYSYFKECLYSIDSDVTYMDGLYFMKGGVPGLYTFMEAAITLTEDEEIECAFLEDGICHYYATDKSRYESPSYYMLNWMYSYTNYVIQLKGDEENAVPSDIEGTYIRDDSSASIVINKVGEDQFEIDGHASWAFRSGDISGELTRINSQQLAYVESWEDYRAELRIITYGDRLFVLTVEGSFGGLNVSFNGTYRKQ